MASVLKISIDDIQEIVSALSSAVRCGYGPSFQHTIVSTETGNVLITNHGIQILKTLELKHPLARFVVTAVADHYKGVGDDTKSFVLLLNELLIKSERVVLSEKDALSDQDGRSLKLSQDIDFVLNELISPLFQAMDRFCCRSIASVPKANSTGQHLKHLLMGAMRSHIHDYDVAHLGSLLAEFVDNWSLQKESVITKSTVAFLINNQKHLFVENFGKPMSSSCLLPGYLISRGFCNAKGFLMADSAKNSVKFILLSCGIDTINNDNNSVEYYKIPSSSSKEQAYKVIGDTRQRTEEFLIHAQRLGVTLIITPSQLSSLEKDGCFRHKITAIHTVPEEELQFISQMCDVEIVYDTREFTIENVGHLKNCEQLTFGMQTFVNLQPDDLSLSSSFVVGGPTEAISRQTKLLLIDCLQILLGALMSEEDSFYSSVGGVGSSMESLYINGSATKSSRMSEGEDSGICGTFSDHSDASTQLSPLLTPTDRPNFIPDNSEEALSTEYLYTISVGGAFELALHEVINKHLRTQPPGAPGTTALTILKEALLALPQLLHTNAYYIAKPRWLETLSNAKQTIKRGHAIGIDAAEGTAVKQTLTHSFPNKCQLVVNVLTTLRQLLRLQHVT